MPYLQSSTKVGTYFVLSLSPSLFPALDGFFRKIRQRLEPSSYAYPGTLTSPELFPIFYPSYISVPLSEQWLVSCFSHHLCELSVIQERSFRIISRVNSGSNPISSSTRVCTTHHPLYYSPQDIDSDIAYLHSIPPRNDTVSDPMSSIWMVNSHSSTYKKTRPKAFQHDTIELCQ